MLTKSRQELPRELAVIGVLAKAGLPKKRIIQQPMPQHFFGVTLAIFGQKTFDWCAHCIANALTDKTPDPLFFGRM